MSPTKWMQEFQRQEADFALANMLLGSGEYLQTRTPSAMRRGPVTAMPAVLVGKAVAGRMKVR